MSTRPARRCTSPSSRDSAATHWSSGAGQSRGLWAISQNNGTISHHHAVGADHRPWMTAEIGDLGVQVLRAVKQTLDPVGILNPGKLIP